MLEIWNSDAINIPNFSSFVPFLAKYTVFLGAKIYKAEKKKTLLPCRFRLPLVQLPKCIDCIDWTFIAWMAILHCLNLRLGGLASALILEVLSLKQCSIAIYTVIVLLIQVLAVALWGTQICQALVSFFSVLSILSPNKIVSIFCCNWRLFQ